MATATRKQIEAALRAQGFVEVARGDWEGDGVIVNLDIAHFPGTAWVTTVYNGRRIAKNHVAYHELLAMYS